MKISTRMRYGTRIMVELGLFHSDGIASIRELADQQNLSPKYLEQIMIPLRAAGLVMAERGKQGGYKLAKSPDQIRIIDIFHALEGSTALVFCTDHPNDCKRSRACPTWGLWKRLKDGIEQIMADTTLMDLITDHVGAISKND